MMLKAVTPFKIHDENQGVIPTTQGKLRKGLGVPGNMKSNPSDPVKPQTINFTAKSERKGLSVLSTKDLNNRINTQSKPAANRFLDTVEKSKTVLFQKSDLQLAVAETTKGGSSTSNKYDNITWVRLK